MRHRGLALDRAAIQACKLLDDLITISLRGQLPRAPLLRPDGDAPGVYRYLAGEDARFNGGDVIDDPIPLINAGLCKLGRKNRMGVFPIEDGCSVRHVLVSAYCAEALSLREAEAYLGGDLLGIG